MDIQDLYEETDEYPNLETVESQWQLKMKGAMPIGVSRGKMQKNRNNNK